MCGDFPCLRSSISNSGSGQEKQKILFSAIRDSDNKGKVVDVIMPVTEIDRANMIFERIRYTGQPEQARQDAPSKEQEARVGQEAPQREQERPRQGKRL